MLEAEQGFAVTPHPRSDVVDSEEMLGEHLFLYDERTGDIQTLNGGAAVVWLLCDGIRDLPSIANEIASYFELPEQEVLYQVQEAVGQFQELGLLES